MPASRRRRGHGESPLCPKELSRNGRCDQRMLSRSAAPSAGAANPDDPIVANGVGLVPEPSARDRTITFDLLLKRSPEGE